jgi:hypothetical protein
MIEHPSKKNPWRRPTFPELRLEYHRLSEAYLLSSEWEVKPSPRLTSGFSHDIHHFLRFTMINFNGANFYIQLV